MFFNTVEPLPKGPYKGFSHPDSFAFVLLYLYSVCPSCKKAVHFSVNFITNIV